MLGRTRKKVVTAKWGTLARGMVQHGRWKYSGKTWLHKDATEDTKQVQQENLVIEGDSKNVIKIQQVAFHLFQKYESSSFLHIYRKVNKVAMRWQNTGSWREVTNCMLRFYFGHWVANLFQNFNFSVLLVLWSYICTYFSSFNNHTFDFLFNIHHHYW